MAVDVKAGPQFDAGVPKPLFEIRVPATNFGSSYDVGKDGRFLIPVPVEPAGKSGPAPITVVLNWPAGLKK